MKQKSRDIILTEKTLSMFNEKLRNRIECYAAKRESLKIEELTLLKEIVEIEKKFPFLLRSTFNKKTLNQLKEKAQNGKAYRKWGMLIGQLAEYASEYRTYAPHREKKEG